MLLVAALIAFTMPSLLRDISDRRQLDESSKTTSGTITRHYQLSGTKGCRGRVEIAYQVAGEQHFATAIWCGEDLIGRQVDVKFLPNNPKVSEAVSSSIGLKSTREGYGSAAFVLLVAIIMLAAAHADWRKGR